MIITAVRHLEPFPLTPGGNDVDRPLAAIQSEDIALLKQAVGYGYDLALVSPYRRCLQTAERIKDCSTVWMESADLRESAHPGQEFTVRNKVLTHVESGFELRDRVSRLLRELYGSPHEEVLLVTHGDVINALRWCIENWSLTKYRSAFNDPSNYVGFGSVWTFNTFQGVMERRESPDFDVTLSARFDSWRRLRFGPLIKQEDWESDSGDISGATPRPWRRMGEV